MNLEHVIRALRRHEAELRAAGVLRLAVFGSTARGEAGATSDVDLLASFDAGRDLSLLDVIGIENRIADWLGRSVDLIEEDALKPRARADREAVRAFWRSASALRGHFGQHRAHPAVHGGNDP